MKRSINDNGIVDNTLANISIRRRRHDHDEFDSRDDDDDDNDIKPIE
jgi:hypothetical protein